MVADIATGGWLGVLVLVVVVLFIVYLVRRV